jgi:uracil-DNA glycosylase
MICSNIKLTWQRESIGIEASFFTSEINASSGIGTRNTDRRHVRARLIDLEDGIKALVTVHPSYLLRLPDADAKAREYERFVDDLRIAAGLLKKSARAA